MTVVCTREIEGCMREIEGCMRENAIARGDRSVYVCVSYLIRVTSMHYMKSICMFEDDVMS